MFISHSYLFQRCIVHVTFTPRLEPMQVKLEAVRIMERKAEAERKRKEAASPAEKAPEPPSDKVSFDCCEA